jgi:hypothetical protein
MGRYLLSSQRSVKGWAINAEHCRDFADRDIPVRQQLASVRDLSSFMGARKYLPAEERDSIVLVGSSLFRVSSALFAASTPGFILAFQLNHWHNRDRPYSHQTARRSFVLSCIAFNSSINRSSSRSLNRPASRSTSPLSFM